MRYTASLFLVSAVAACYEHAADVTAVMDNTTYNAGSEVLVRLAPAASANASVRYAGKKSLWSPVSR